MINITQLHEITPEELLDLISKGLKEPLQELLTNPEPQQEKYLTRKEVSHLLSISLPTLGDWVKRGLIQSYRIGNRVFFKASEIDASLKQIKF